MTSPRTHGAPDDDLAAGGPGDRATEDRATEVEPDDDLLAPDEELFVDGTVGRSELAAERDEYLEALQRVKAEFDNYRKRTEKQRDEMVERATGRLVEELLPVLDACDAALAHGATEVEPVHAALLDALASEGLERMASVGEPFDPNLHEAVMHEPADDDGDDGKTVVVDALRNGYLWKGRVLRPAMVKVKG